MNNVVKGAKVTMRMRGNGSKADTFVTEPYKILKADNSAGSYQSRPTRDGSRNYSNPG